MIEPEPIDSIHAMSMRAIALIREKTIDAKMRVAVWEPRPMPPAFHIRVRR